MCIEKSFGSVEFLTPATTDNVRNSEKFQIMDGTNFSEGVELLRLTLH
jgi:hypothetical protein